MREFWSGEARHNGNLLAALTLLSEDSFDMELPTSIELHQKVKFADFSERIMGKKILGFSSPVFTSNHKLSVVVFKLADVLHARNWTSFINLLTHSKSVGLCNLPTGVVFFIPSTFQAPYLPDLPKDMVTDGNLFTYGILKSRQKAQVKQKSPAALTTLPATTPSPSVAGQKKRRSTKKAPTPSKPRSALGFIEHDLPITSGSTSETQIKQEPEESPEISHTVKQEESSTTDSSDEDLPDLPPATVKSKKIHGNADNLKTQTVCDMNIKQESSDTETDSDVERPVAKKRKTVKHDSDKKYSNKTQQVSRESSPDSQELVPIPQPQSLKIDAKNLQRLNVNVSKLSSPISDEAYCPEINTSQSTKQTFKGTEDDSKQHSIPLKRKPAEIPVDDDDLKGKRSKKNKPVEAHDKAISDNVSDVDSTGMVQKPSNTKQEIKQDAGEDDKKWLSAKTTKEEDAGAFGEECGAMILGQLSELYIIQKYTHGKLALGKERAEKLINNVVTKCEASLSTELMLTQLSDLYVIQKYAKGDLKLDQGTAVTFIDKLVANCEASIKHEPKSELWPPKTEFKEDIETKDMKLKEKNKSESGIKELKCVELDEESDSTGSEKEISTSASDDVDVIAPKPNSPLEIEKENAKLTGKRGNFEKKKGGRQEKEKELREKPPSSQAPKNSDSEVKTVMKTEESDSSDSEHEFDDIEITPIVIDGDTSSAESSHVDEIDSKHHLKKLLENGTKNTPQKSPKVSKATVEPEVNKGEKITEKKFKMGKKVKVKEDIDKPVQRAKKKKFEGESAVDDLSAAEIPKKKKKKTKIDESPKEPKKKKDLTVNKDVLPVCVENNEAETPKKKKSKKTTENEDIVAEKTKKKKSKLPTEDKEKKKKSLDSVENSLVEAKKAKRKKVLKPAEDETVQYVKTKTKKLEKSTENAEVVAKKKEKSNSGESSKNKDIGTTKTPQKKANEAEDSETKKTKKKKPSKGVTDKKPSQNEGTDVKKKKKSKERVVNPTVNPVIKPDPELKKGSNDDSSSCDSTSSSSSDEEKDAAGKTLDIKPKLQGQPFTMDLHVFKTQDTTTATKSKSKIDHSSSDDSSSDDSTSSSDELDNSTDHKSPQSLSKKNNAGTTNKESFQSLRNKKHTGIRNKVSIQSLRSKKSSGFEPKQALKKTPRTNTSDDSTSDDDDSPVNPRIIGTKELKQAQKKVPSKETTDESTSDDDSSVDQRFVGTAVGNDVKSSSGVDGKEAESVTGLRSVETAVNENGKKLNSKERKLSKWKETNRERLKARREADKVKKKLKEAGKMKQGKTTLIKEAKGPNKTIRKDKKIAASTENISNANASEDKQTKVKGAKKGNKINPATVTPGKTVTESAVKKKSGKKEKTKTKEQTTKSKAKKQNVKSNKNKGSKANDTASQNLRVGEEISPSNNDNAVVTRTHTIDQHDEFSPPPDNSTVTQANTEAHIHCADWRLGGIGETNVIKPIEIIPESCLADENRPMFINQITPTPGTETSLNRHQRFGETGVEGGNVHETSSMQTNKNTSETTLSENHTRQTDSFFVHPSVSIHGNNNDLSGPAESANNSTEKQSLSLRRNQDWDSNKRDSSMERRDRYNNESARDHSAIWRRNDQRYYRDNSRSPYRDNFQRSRSRDPASRSRYSESRDLKSPRDHSTRGENNDRPNFRDSDRSGRSNPSSTTHNNESRERQSSHNHSTESESNNRRQFRDFPKSHSADQSSRSRYSESRDVKSLVGPQPEDSSRSRSRDRRESTSSNSKLFSSPPGNRRAEQVDDFFRNVPKIKDGRRSFDEDYRNGRNSDRHRMGKPSHSGVERHRKSSESCKNSDIGQIDQAINQDRPEIQRNEHNDNRYGPTKIRNDYHHRGYSYQDRNVRSSRDMAALKQSGDIPKVNTAQEELSSHKIANVEKAFSQDVSKDSKKTDSLSEPLKSASEPYMQLKNNTRPQDVSQVSRFSEYIDSNKSRDRVIPSLMEDSYKQPSESHHQTDQHYFSFESTNKEPNPMIWNVISPPRDNPHVHRSRGVALRPARGRGGRGRGRGRGRGWNQGNDWRRMQDSNRVQISGNISRVDVKYSN